MPYGNLNVDVVQSSTANTPPQFNDGNGTQVGTLCRAWVNFNGSPTSGSATIRGSFNVSSVTINGTGDYTVNFANALPDGNYSWAAVAGKTSGRNTFVEPVPDTTPTWSSTQFRMYVWNPTGGAPSNESYVSAVVFR